MVLTAMSTGAWGYTLAAVLLAGLLLFFLPIRTTIKNLISFTVSSFVIVALDLIYIFLLPSNGSVSQYSVDGVLVDSYRHTPLSAVAWAAIVGLIVFGPYGAGLLIWKKIVWRPSPPDPEVAP